MFDYGVFYGSFCCYFFAVVRMSDNFCMKLMSVVAIVCRSVCRFYMNILVLNMESCT